MDAKTFISRGDKLFELKRFKNAIEEYSSVFSLDVHNNYAYQQISRCWIQLNDKKKALEFAEKALEHDPASSYNYYLVAFIKNYSGQYIEAEKLVKKAIEINSRVPSYFGCMARSQFGSYDPEIRPDNYRNAINSALAGLQINPDESTCLIVLARVYAQLKDIGRFYQYSERALAVGPNDPFTHYEIAIGFFAIESYQKAKHHLVIALKLNPRLSGAKSLLGKINKSGTGRKYTFGEIIIFITMYILFLVIAIAIIGVLATILLH